MTDTKAFQFKQFSISQDQCAMKVGTDGILLGAWADVTNTQYILDIGTGTGLIAIMLAQRSESALIHGVEIDELAAVQAADNMAKSPWAGRLKITQGPIQEFAKNPGRKYDLIVSNPPFFSGGTFSSSQDKTSVRHTVKLPHGDLLVAARSLLTKDGRFCVILPKMEGLRFMEMAINYGLHCSKATEVRPLDNKPVERLLLQLERSEKKLEKDSLVIQHEGVNNWTDAFKTLTGDFYL